MFFPLFCSGIKGADEDELREMASTPHNKHVYNVPNFNKIQDVQKKIISEVCSGVDEQLSALVSGEECEWNISWSISIAVLSDYLANKSIISIFFLTF